jgi:hypothetical protein
MNQGLSALYSMLKGISPRFRIFRQKTGSLSSDINGQVLPPSSFHSEFYLVSSGHRKPDVPIMAGVCRLFTYGACTEAGWLKSTKFVLHCDLFDAIRFNVVKQLIAILFSMLLVWMHITPTSVPASPVCVLIAVTGWLVAQQNQRPSRNLRPQSRRNPPRKIKFPCSPQVLSLGHCRKIRRVQNFPFLLRRC